MIINLVGVLVEAAKGVNLVVATVGHRGVDKTSGALSQGAGDLGPIAIHGRTVLEG